MSRRKDDQPPRAVKLHKNEPTTDPTKVSAVVMDEESVKLCRSRLPEHRPRPDSQRIEVTEAAELSVPSNGVTNGNGHNGEPHA